MNKNLRESGLSLFELGQSLGLAPPSHGYTIAEKSPEIVTAPGVYFPIKRGRVIPLKPRADGGTVRPKTMIEKMQEAIDTPASNVPLELSPGPYEKGNKGIPGGGGVAREWTGPTPWRKNIPLASRQFGGNVDPLKEFENTGINYSLNSMAPTQQGIEATANTASIQPTPINIAPSPGPQPTGEVLQPTISPSQPLTGMAEYEANAARTRGIAPSGIQTQGQPTTPKFSLGSVNPLTAFAPPQFRERKSSPVFRSEQKAAFDKKMKSYNDLMASITGGIPLQPRAVGGVTDPSMTEEDLKRLREAFPDMITSHEQPVIGAENLPSQVPLAQSHRTGEPMAIFGEASPRLKAAFPKYPNMVSVTAGPGSLPDDYPKIFDITKQPEGNLASNAPIPQSPGIKQGIIDIGTGKNLTLAQEALLNKPEIQTPVTETVKNEETTPTTPDTSLSDFRKEILPSGETKYTLPGTEGAATVGPERRFMGAQEILPGEKQYPASEGRTVSGDELARERISHEIDAQRKTWEKELAPRERSYYEAHPEEKLADEEAERIRQENKPIMDIYMKLIEEARRRAGGFGLMGLRPRRAREVQTASIAALPQLTQGLEKLRATPEKGGQVTPHITEDAQGNKFFTYPPARGRGVVNVPIGMKGKMSQTPYKIGERQKFIGKGGGEYEGTFLGLNPNNEPEWGNVEKIAEKPTAEKGGQNWMLPGGSSVISYDGGRTYAMPDGQIKPMPPTAVKVPGGATLSEIKIEKAKEQARLELERVQDPSKPSPEKAALEGTGPYKRIASIFEAVAGGLGFDLLIGERGFFPDIADAKQYLRSVKQMGKAALMNSSRGAIWEQQKIEELFPNPDKTFTNPRIEARKFGNLLDVLAIEKMFNNQAILNAVTPEEIGKYRNSNNEIDRLISFISEPVRGKGLTNEERALIEKYRKK